MIFEKIFFFFSFSPTLILSKDNFQNAFHSTKMKVKKADMSFLAAVLLKSNCCV